MDSNKYKDYQVSDFVDDEQFRRWVLEGDQREALFWQKFLQDYPLQADNVAKSRTFLLSINAHFDNEIKSISQQEAITSFNKLAEKITEPPKLVPLRRKYLHWGIAASILLILGFLSFPFFQNNHPAKIYSTGNGERLTVQLPDASTVDLNANSTIIYFPNKWNQLDAREVWLEGEAFFNVKRKAERTNFYVHAEELKIEVLGTQFNVRTRDAKSEVVLEEGTIELEIIDTDGTESNHTMQPGDYISYSKKDKTIDMKKVRANNYSAWKDGMVVFDNIPLSAAVREMEILYGIQFQFNNKALKDRNIQLSAPANSLDQVLETIGLIYPEEINIKREIERVVIY